MFFDVWCVTSERVVCVIDRALDRHLPRAVVRERSAPGLHRWCPTHAVGVLNGTTCSHGIDGWRAVSGDGRRQNDFWYSVSSPLSGIVNSANAAVPRLSCFPPTHATLPVLLHNSDSPRKRSYTAILRLDLYVCMSGPNFTVIAALALSPYTVAC